MRKQNKYQIWDKGVLVPAYQRKPKDPKAIPLVVTNAQERRLGIKYYTPADKEVTNVTLLVRIKGEKFEFGTLVFTRGVNIQVADNSDFAKFVIESIGRHSRGDWGDMCAEDKAKNELALNQGDLRLFSAYKKEGLPKIWIITEADRSLTTVLFPSEY